jgi:protein-tyrosine phosphatase
VATPHVLRDSWVNDDASARDQLVMKLNTLLGGRPAILPGCEFYWASDALELLERPDAPLTTLNRSRYLLVEFASGVAPRGFADVLHELAINGVSALIAHPERNPLFVRDPDRLAAYVRDGAVVQITAGSLLGDFGRWARDACHEFFRRRLVHVIASDAHSVDRRPPRLSEAREMVRHSWGAEAEEALFVANPEAIVASQPLPWQPD